MQPFDHQTYVGTEHLFFGATNVVWIQKMAPNCFPSSVVDRQRNPFIEIANVAVELFPRFDTCIGHFDHT